MSLTYTKRYVMYLKKATIIQDNIGNFIKLCKKKKNN